jgi:hypothetical protein
VQVLGEDHPSTLTAMCELAETLNELGKLSAARELVEKALELGRGPLGPGPEHPRGEDHPITLAAKACLAAVLRSEGALVAARKLQEEVVGAFRELLGPGHRLAVAASKALADTLAKQNEQLPALPHISLYIDGPVQESP